MYDKLTKFMDIRNSRWVFAKVGQTVKQLLIVLAAGTGLITAAHGQGSILYIGNSGGEVFGRSEYDLAAHMPQNYLNFGPGTTINAMVGVGGNVALGLNSGANVSVRQVNNLSTVVSSLNTGNATTALAAGSAGQLAIGDAGNLVFLRQSTDLLSYPAGYTSTDGLNFGSPITATAILPSGDVLVATQTGLLAIRSGTDLFNVPSGAVTGYINYGTTITALTVDGTGRIVIGLDNGYVDTRAAEDLSISLGLVNFGTRITALASMLDGTDTIAIGLNTGEVSLRDASNLTADIQTVKFTFTEAITALAFSEDGNLGIGTATSLVYIRDGSNLLVTPEGFVGSDGLNFNAPITSLAFAVPEPSSVGLLVLALTGAVWVGRRKVCGPLTSK